MENSEQLKEIVKQKYSEIALQVLVGNLPEPLRKDAEMYAGCIAGAIQKETYLKLIQTNGFSNITLQKEKAINIPDDILKNYLNENELSGFNNW